MYMSYCKFEGTFAELRSCLATVDEHINEEAESEVSKREIDEFKNMVMFFADWITYHDLLDEFGEVKEDALEEVLDAMSKSYEPEEYDY